MNAHSLKLAALLAAFLLTAAAPAPAADPAPTVTLAGDHKVAHTPFGPIVILFTAEQTGGAYGSFLTTEPAGVVGPSHTHTVRAEAYYVLAGNYRFTIGGKAYDVGAGSTLTVPVNVSSQYSSIGPDEGHLIVSELPGGFEQFFVEIEESGADTPAKINELEKKWGIVDSSLETMAKAP